MHANPNDDPSFDLPDLVEHALHSFWRGSSREFDRLLSDGNGEDSAVCGLLAGLIDEHAHVLKVPDRIGDYAIAHQIGRGGMATVYEAKQERTGRIVALKLIRRWGTTDRARFRVFRREVDMLARLKHPGIATLYDAGITDDGQHYFAMELAGGLTLAEYMARGRCKWSHTRLRDRLELFSKICGAMNYAHQRGVIHRDLKPSNIFVGPDGQPKILDFGLARLLDNDPAVTASYSEEGRLVGTLQYMSPEQASGDPNDLDIRSDVYSLGVILFELLTGERPYPVGRMALPEAVRNISETEPKRPGLIDSRLKGDPENIVLKALEKEPERRYQSAAALAEDIERHLANKPILARSPSAAYHLRKLVTRQKLPAALIAALLVVTTIFVVIFGVQATQVVEERDSARATAHKAEKINEFLGRMLAYMDPNEVGYNIPIREVLDKAAADVDSELQEQPEIRASLHETIGRSYRALKLYEHAERHLTAALDLRRDVFGERHPAFASSLHELGQLAGEQRLEGADQLLNAALELRRDLFGEWHPDVAASLHDIGLVRAGYGNYPEAIQLLQEALDMRRRLLGEHRDTAESLHVLARLLMSFGRYDEAEQMFHVALEMRRRLFGEDHSDVASTLRELAEIHWHRGEYAKGEQFTREVIAIYRRVYGRDHYELALAMTELAGNLHAQCKLVEAESVGRGSLEMQRRIGRDVALCANNFGVFLRKQGRYKEAELLSREVFGIWTESPANAFACHNLASVLFQLGNIEEAERLFRTAIRVWSDTFGTKNPALAAALIGLGELQQFQGDHAEAERLFAQATAVRLDRLGSDHGLTAASLVYQAGNLHASGKPGAEELFVNALEVLRRKLVEHHPRISWALSGLANLKKDSGDLDAAEELFREALAIERAIPREKHPVLASCLQGLAEVLMERGHPSAAEPLLREALDIRRVRLAEGDRRIAVTQSILGECLVSLETYDQAETLLAESYPVIETAFGPQHRITQEARHRLIDLYESTGQPELADPYRPSPDAARSDDLIHAPEPAMTENPSG